MDIAHKRRLAAYDITRSYEWNYEHAPAPDRIQVPDCPGSWTFCGRPVASPIGIAAGPLLNGQWVLYYAARGFDVVTYKTVRSRRRESYDVPNLLPVRGERLVDARGQVVAEPELGVPDSWAISFGMPSRDPAVWQEDVRAARRGLRPDQVLVVSVVASPDRGWTLDRIAADFAQCARWARDGGADAIEANLSCPNVETQEGHLYASDDASAAIAAAIRRAVPDAPLILKVGLFDDRQQARRFVEAVSGLAAAVSTTNTISAVVRSESGEPMFAGARRGIGGRLIEARCLEELQMLHGLVSDVGSDLQLISVGGVSTAEHVRARLRAGAHHVQLATAAMLDPDIAISLRRRCAVPSPA